MDPWDDFEFQIGYLVRLRGGDGLFHRSPSGVVVAQVLERCSGGAQRMYLVQHAFGDGQTCVSRFHEATVELVPPPEPREGSGSPDRR